MKPKITIEAVLLLCGLLFLTGCVGFRSDTKAIRGDAYEYALSELFRTNHSDVFYLQASGSEIRDLRSKLPELKIQKANRSEISFAPLDDWEPQEENSKTKFGSVS